MANIIDILASPGGRRTATRSFSAAIARLMPTDENVIRQNIMENLPEIGARSAMGGQTFDPRTKQFVESFYSGRPTPELDAGYMMAPKPELPNARQYSPDMPISADDFEEATNLITQEQVLNLLNDPQMMEDLRRGGMLGSWPDTGFLVVDPSRQYLTKSGAIRAGRRSGQLAGFDPRSGDFPVTGPEADAILRRRKQIELSAAIAAMAGGTGALAARD